MPHIVFPLQLASWFLSLRPVFQGLAHWILVLRNFAAISSKLIPALPALPPIPSLDAPTAFSGLRDGIVSPSVSSISATSTASAVSAASAMSVASAVSTASAAISAVSAIAVASTESIAIESQSSFFSSPISAFQSSLMLVTPNQLPDLVISIFILLFIISASLVILPIFFYFLINTAKISSAFTRTLRIFAKLFKTNLISTAKISSAFTRTSGIFAKLFRTNPIPYLVPACVPPVFSPVQLVICLVPPLVLWTGLVCLHLSSPMTLLTGFVARVPVIFHLGLDHVDSHQWANLGFGMSIFPRVGAKENSHCETVGCHLPRGVEDMDHTGHPNATYHRYNFRTNYA